MIIIIGNFDVWSSAIRIFNTLNQIGITRSMKKVASLSPADLSS